MISQKTFPVNTRNTINAIMASLVQLNLSNNMKEIGVFMDRASTDLAVATANYHLARISGERAATVAMVYSSVRAIVASKLATAVHTLTPDQMEAAQFAIYREITGSFNQGLLQAGSDWTQCRMVHTTQFEFSINASKEYAVEAANSAYGFADQAVAAGGI